MVTGPLPLDRRVKMLSFEQWTLNDINQRTNKKYCLLEKRISSSSFRFYLSRTCISIIGWIVVYKCHHEINSIKFQSPKIKSRVRSFISVQGMRNDYFDAELYIYIFGCNLLPVSFIFIWLSCNIACMHLTSLFTEWIIRLKCMYTRSFFFFFLSFFLFFFFFFFCYI
jgi:hypothetical protein